MKIIVLENVNEISSFSLVCRRFSQVVKSIDSSKLTMAIARSRLPRIKQANESDIHVRCIFNKKANIITIAGVNSLDQYNGVDNVEIRTYKLNQTSLFYDCNFEIDFVLMYKYSLKRETIDYLMSD